MEPCLVDDSHPPTGLNPFSRRVSLRGLEGPKARLTLEGLSLRVNQLVPGCLWVPLRTKPCQVARFSPKRPSLAVRQILFDGFGGGSMGMRSRKVHAGICQICFILRSLFQAFYPNVLC